MKTLIIYQSIHQSNTEKIAQKMAEVLGADLKKPNEVKTEDLANYDLIGFGSGIYSAHFHASILKLIESLPDMNSKKAFAFYTSTLVVKKFASNTEARLASKNFSVLGTYGCQGKSTWHPFGLTINILKAHPNEKDLALAVSFAEAIKNK
jgi:flavodoxin